MKTFLYSSETFQLGFLKNNSTASFCCLQRAFLHIIFYFYYFHNIFVRWIGELLLLQMKEIEAQRDESLFSDRLRNVFTSKCILLSKWGDAEIYFRECPLERINWVDIDVETASWRPWSWGRRGQSLLLRRRLNIHKSISGQSGNVRDDLSHSQCFGKVLKTG